jgi:hypothetical protein
MRLTVQDHARLLSTTTPVTDWHVAAQANGYETLVKQRIHSLSVACAHRNLRKIVVERSKKK